jgi:ABC-2 type transport system ATP-binding protein
MSLIEATDLSKIYQGKTRNVVALDGINFSLHPGEAVAILGPVGSGKSTLFRLLAGLVTPSTGDLWLQERPASEPKARIGVSFVPEHPRFDSYMTARAAVRLSGRLEGVDAVQLEDEVTFQLKRLGLSKWADTAVSKFSREMARRLALASALVSTPHLLIIDEPPDKFDLLTRSILIEALSRAKERGTSILHFAHSVTFVEKTVNRVLVLERGRITRDIPLAELVEERLLVEIEAGIGEWLIELPSELGQVVSVSRKRLIVKLDDESAINGIIDYLRLNHIRIHTVGRHKNSPDSTWIEVKKTPEGVQR